jgi:hypothetical protein
MWSMNLWIRIAIVVALGIGLWLPAEETQAAGSWEWSVTPYLWTSSVGAKVKEDGVVISDNDVAFTDLLSNLDFALAAHAEGRRGRVGLLFDFFYIDLSTSETVPDHQDPEAPPPGSVVDLDIEQLILEGGGFYRLSGEETGLDLLFGLRWIGMDEVIQLTPPFPPNAPGQTKKSSPNLTDGFLGLRYVGQIGNKWGYSIRGDVATGDTELTLNGQAFFKYQIGQTGKYGLLFGYRYMGMEIKETIQGVVVETDLILSGPVFGFMFKW